MRPDQRLATEIFSTVVGPSLVKRVAEILAPEGIAVMPLKGVLLQKLVYGADVFRPISDVDLLVPHRRFADATRVLEKAGFSDSHWERGGWQVTLTNPQGPPLGVDLHRELSRTIRSRLTADGLFARGSENRDLFGTTVVLPSGVDLFAHLVLHATMHWVNTGEIHNPRDFSAVPTILSLDPHLCATHLHNQGLAAHALALFPIIDPAGSDAFISMLLTALRAGCRPLARARVGAATCQSLCRQYGPSRLPRRIASLVLAPSVTRALVSALHDRFFQLAARPNGNATVTDRRLPR